MAKKVKNETKKEPKGVRRVSVLGSSLALGDEHEQGEEASTYVESLGAGWKLTQGEEGPHRETARAGD